MRLARRHLGGLCAVLVAAATAATGIALAAEESKTPARLANSGVPAATAPWRCPSREPARVTSSRVGAAVTLAPAGATQVLLCRYDGPFGARSSTIAHRFRLVAALTLDGTRTRRLAAELDRLPKMPYSCHDRSGSVVVGYFAKPYVAGDRGTATNGHVIHNPRG